ncbi:hypothetical protein K3G63_10235 [Hymenobacter sp. HSC-4F20]|uniref:hypothetical protein n=1 Tax=Hymenobacter sp. HSC-4F20 TaxID=2864135 RepID=UPI001C734059|nr:hypothetical protein [Hymenobacter sp. HSC-4F20]MBX0290818.1 hypothetical protein [Hymenobacter sp. HSC-4F20]
MNQPQTKAHLVQLLQAGHTVTVRWDCGGDESFVYTSVDNQELESQYSETNDFPYGLEHYLTEQLDLPSAGDFSMSGSGRFFLEGQAVGLDYQSTATVYEDELDEDFYEQFTDEELRNMGLERPDPAAQKPQEAAPTTPEVDEEMSAEYSGRRVLFQVHEAQS